MVDAHPERDATLRSYANSIQGEKDRVEAEGDTQMTRAEFNALPSSE